MCRPRLWNGVAALECPVVRLECMHVTERKWKSKEGTWQPLCGERRDADMAALERLIGCECAPTKAQRWQKGIKINWWLKVETRATLECLVVSRKYAHRVEEWRELFCKVDKLKAGISTVGSACALECLVGAAWKIPVTTFSHVFQPLEALSGYTVFLWLRHVVMCRHEKDARQSSFQGVLMVFVWLELLVERAVVSVHSSDTPTAFESWDDFSCSCWLFTILNNQKLFTILMNLRNLTVI